MNNTPSTGFPGATRRQRQLVEGGYVPPGVDVQLPEGRGPVVADTLMRDDDSVVRPHRGADQWPSAEVLLADQA
ncbi:MAG: hypothetical protein ACR2P2_03460 [Nakamurella sp.]